MADAGTILKNRYELLGKIGSGGVSTVYLAVDRNRNKAWAVKEIYTASKRTDGGTKNRALAEAMLMAKLKYPAFPQIAEVIEGEDALYIVMEYLAGRTLADILRERGPMDWMETARIGILLCEALTYLHTLPAPVIYGDLNPSNVMLLNRKPPVISLFDFGAARVYEGRAAIEEEYFGTAGFVAPELISKSAPADMRADIYSLGAMLHWLATGNVVQGGLEQPFEQEQSDDLDTIIQRCLRQHPEERYGSCIEVKDDLERYLASGNAPLLRGVDCVHAEKMGFGHNTTRRLRAGVPLGSEEKQAADPAEQAKQKLAYHPGVKILVCQSEEEI